MFTLTYDMHVARIHIGRPDKRNAVTVAGWERLSAILGQIKREEPRAVLLHADRGAVFSAGADLDELAALATRPEQRARFRQAMADAFAALRGLAMPTIAAVEGGCYGAGVALAMACDVRVATRTARFAIPPATLGILYPAEDVARLTELVGAPQAIRVLASGDAVDGVEAARIGLVELLAEDALADAAALAARIAANAPESVVGLKRFVQARDAKDAAAAFEDAFGGAAFQAWAKAREARG